MNISNIFEKHPLIFLQFVGWATYFFADWFDHLSKGHYLFLPSLLCSITALILTGLVAYTTNKVACFGKKIQISTFIFSLILATILWHKVWAIMHGNAETYSELAQQFLALNQYTISQWLSTGYYPLFLFLAWGGFYIGSKWFFAHQQQQHDLNNALLKAKHAQLQTLRYQLNPHFLFNVLNNIDVSVMSNDPTTAHNMLKHLSSFLRKSLQQGEQDKVTVKEEISVIKDFIHIEQVRFADALTIAISVNAACQSAMIPPMVLQPLMENAIKFAWSQLEQGQVELSINKRDAALFISIKNSKAAIQNSTVGTGTGLKNTKERLKLVYGDDASVYTKEEKNSYQVNLSIPWEEMLS